MFIVLTSAMTARFHSWYLFPALTKQAYWKRHMNGDQNPGLEGPMSCDASNNCPQSCPPKPWLFGVYSVYWMKYYPVIQGIFGILNRYKDPVMNQDFMLHAMILCRTLTGRSRGTLGIPGAGGGCGWKGWKGFFGWYCTKVRKPLWVVS